ncbi:Ger(x)C family spore germination protein [Gorillibacterium sp. CAU 1737]|uniref:Ger(x)C family spore germination protein n=1 Tax=Gorillibacterium sp. CAU 1737 TaxID=3140362 RepID=UPI003261C301
MKAIKLAMALVMLFGLTGCWSRVELDEWAFAFGLYLDVGPAPGTVSVTISTPLPNHLTSGQQTGSSGGANKPYAMITKTGRTIPDALVMIQQDLSRQLSLAELKVILVGKAYAAQGLTDLLEWITRDPEVSMGAFLIGTDNVIQTANLTPIYEQIPSQILMSFASERHMLNTSARDCLVASSYGLGYGLTYITSSSVPTPEKSADGNRTWSGINGVMLFNKEKLKGTLDLEEGRSLALAYGKLKDPSYTIYWNNEKSYANAIFTKTSSRRTVRLEKGRPVFTIHLKGRVGLTTVKDQEGRNANALHNLILRQLNRQIRQNVEQALTKTQEAGTDAMRLGSLVEWNYPKLWQKLRPRWEEAYRKEVDIRVVTDYTLNDYGKQN